MSVKFITRDQFENYLLNKHPNARFKTNECKVCPLALAMLAVKPITAVEVNGSTYSVNDNVSTYKMPRWANRFVDAIDDTGSFVSPKKALEVLRNIK